LPPGVASSSGEFFYTFYTFTEIKLPSVFGVKLFIHCAVLHSFLLIIIIYEWNIVTFVQIAFISYTVDKFDKYSRPFAKSNNE